MKLSRTIRAATLSALLAGCGSSGTAVPDAPGSVSVAAGDAAGTAVVSFAPPASSGGSQVTGYTVTVSPGGIVASGASSPILVTGLTPRTAYTYNVVASSAAGNSVPATTGPLRFYEIQEIFLEPMTQPNDSIFTGTFTFDTLRGAVSNLSGSLTQSMTRNGGSYGPPMTTVSLTHQLSAEATTVGGVSGLLVATFALPSTNVFDPSGFAPGGTEYYGLSTGAMNPKMGGVGNAYVLVFVNTTDPTVPLEQAQWDKLAYGDCTAGGMMMSTCMTGTTVAGYGRAGTMGGHPTSQSQVIVER